LAVVLGAGCLAWGTPLQAQTVIDDFSDAGANTVSPPGQSRSTVGSTTVTDAGLTGVIGGSRTLTVSASSVGGGLPEVRAGVMPMAQVLDYSSTVLVNGAVSLLYDNNGVGLAADVSSGDGIQFNVIADVSSLPYTVTLTLDDGVNSQSSAQNIVVSGLQPVQFLYTAFPMVDLSSLFSIEISFDPNLAGDLEVAAPIETFGEPVCGNGLIELVEECDDGNGANGDGCDTDCTLSAACTYQPPAGTERFVGGCGAPNFVTIQAAVTASASGDTVSVCPGSYPESVIVDQEVTIRSTGGAALTTVQSAGIAFDVRRSGVRIEDLTIEGTTAAVRADSICGLGISSCTLPSRGSTLAIVDNVILNSALGIGWQRKVDCATISGNTMSANGAHIDIDQQENPPAIFVAVQGNALTGGGASGHGMRLSNLGAGLGISLNSIETSTTAGVILADLPPGTQFLENNVRNNASDGLIMQPGTAGVRVITNNIEGNGGVGLANEAPEGTIDATLNWWGSLTGPFHTVDRPLGTGDQILERLGGLDTTFVEFLCAPAPAGFPSVLGVCDDGGGGAEIDFLTFGREPDISPNGRFISFVSARDINGDARLSIDNSDLSDEAFLLNRKPQGKPNSFCIGGISPGAPCTKQSTCKGNLNNDPIITDGVCVLITQLSHDPSGNNSVATPRVTQRGGVFSRMDANVVGANPDLSDEVVVWSARDFRRQSPTNPNTVVDAISNGAGLDSQQPAPARSGRFVVMESEANPTGGNADGNIELFVFDTARLTWQQVTNTVAPVENRRPSTTTGRQILFDSNADLAGGNADGNREIFLAEARGNTFTMTQLTTSVLPVENRAGQLARRGRINSFSSNGNYVAQNADGNREVFIVERGVFEQLTHSTAGENVNPHGNPKGRFVTFESTADLENGGNAISNRRVFYYDRLLDTLTIVSRSFFGTNTVPRMSNGRFIVWQSTSNLTGQNPTNEDVIYAFDRRRDD
jgi:cysteine-rich repeat protein